MDAVIKVLGHHLRQRTISSTLEYGSECSGLDAPFHGLRSVVDAIQAEIGVVDAVSVSFDTLRFAPCTLDSRLSRLCCLV